MDIQQRSAALEPCGVPSLFLLLVSDAAHSEGTALWARDPDLHR